MKTVLPELLAMAVLNSGTLMSQATPVVDPGLGTLIGNLGIMGVLVWHLWYHTTQSYPKMMDKFSAEMDKTQALFRTEQQLLRDENAKHQERVAAERRLEREEDAREKAELRSMLNQNLQAMRMAVHDVKNTAQAVIGQVAAQEARREANA